MLPEGKGPERNVELVTSYHLLVSEHVENNILGTWLLYLREEEAKCGYRENSVRGQNEAGPPTPTPRKNKRFLRRETTLQCTQWLSSKRY